MYYANPKPYETQKRIIRAFADNQEATVTNDQVSLSVGGIIIFHYKGILVEVTTRLYENAMNRIRECLDGQFEIVPEDWTINGYYTFTYASEISYVKPIWDPTDFIENTKKIIYPYSKRLKKSIIERFGGSMNHFASYWEYKNAIERRDLFYANHFVYRALINMVQVIYALNDAYYTGDKQIARKLAALSYCPVALLDNLSFLLSAPYDSGELERQRVLLSEIVAELNSKCADLILCWSQHPLSLTS